MPESSNTSAACCLVHQLGKCDAVFTCCDRCPTFFADRAKPIYGKPFHGWSCDCDECKGYDERGEPRPGEAPRPQASAATEPLIPAWSYTLLGWVRIYLRCPDHGPFCDGRDCCCRDLHWRPWALLKAGRWRELKWRMFPPQPRRRRG